MKKLVTPIAMKVIIHVMYCNRRNHFIPVRRISPISQSIIPAANCPHGVDSEAFPAASRKFDAKSENNEAKKARFSVFQTDVVQAKDQLGTKPSNGCMVLPINT